MRNILVLLLLAVGMASANAQERKTLIDFDWKFLLGEGTTQCSEETFDDSKWRNVDLPHDWSIESEPKADAPSGNDGGYYATGKGWYRKTLNINKETIGKQLSLYFEGVYMDAEVFVNGKSLGVHHYGYSSFSHDITKLVKEGKNTIAVSVDNSKQKNARWYTGSGIYRHVWLIATDKLHFKQWGTFITTPQVAKDKAAVNVSSEITNDGEQNASVVMNVVVTDMKGNIVAEGKQNATVEAGKTVTVNKELGINNPQLWSPDSPSLYQAKLSIEVDGKEKDCITETFGVRTIEYSAERGFLLNGKPLELNGGCIHSDNGFLGAAAYDRAEVRKVELMKAAGFNAVRTSHNHPSETFLDACDRIGLLCIDESFDNWRSAKTKYDYSIYIDEFWQEDIKALVLRDRNHPSIFCWSVGNEVIERKEIQVVTTARKLSNLCRQLDPTRPVTSALCAWDSDWEIYDPLAETFEIVGYNYMIHKHEGDHKRDPKRIIIQTESYPREAFRNWAYSHDHSYIIGDFVWTSNDYLGESGIGRWYYEGESAGEHYDRNQFPWHAAYCGDIDLLGERKPISYYRDMLWNVDRPVYMAVKEPNGYHGKIKETLWSVWPTFESWNWEGHEGKDIEVEIYSLAPRVRLYLNDKVMGEKPTTRKEEFKAIFKIPYQPGTLRVEAIDEQGNAIAKYNTGRNTLKTAGKPYALRLRADRSVINADGHDLSFVTVEVVDKDGNVCPNAANEVTFKVSGRGSLIGVGNADIKDLGLTTDATHNTWKGRAQGVVRASTKSGNIKVTATAAGLKAASVTVKVK